MYNSMAFSIVTELCSHSCSPFQNISVTPKRNPELSSSQLHFPPALSALGNHSSFSVDLPILGISCKKNLIIYGLLCLASFAQHIKCVWGFVSDILLFFNLLRSFLLYRYKQFICHSVEGHLDCFLFDLIMKMPL